MTYGTGFRLGYLKNRTFADVQTRVRAAGECERRSERRATRRLAEIAAVDPANDISARHNKNRASIAKRR